LAFCGFRVPVDQFSHPSGLQAAKMCGVPPGRMLSCASGPEFFPTLCGAFFFLVFVYEVIELTELSEDFQWW